MLISSNHMIGSVVTHCGIPTRIGCAVYEYSHTYVCVDEHHVYERKGGAETLVDAMTALDPFQAPADYGYQNNKNLSLNFRAGMISTLLKVNGY